MFMVLLAKDEEWSVVGGTLQYSNGRWIIGHQRYVERGMSLNSELWAILHGMEIARQREYENVVVESDCLVAIEMIKDSSDGALSNTIVQKIKEVARQFSMVEFHFVRREGNLVANYLARTYDTADVDIHIIVTPSVFVNKLLLDDYTVIHDV